MMRATCLVVFGLALVSATYSTGKHHTAAVPAYSTPTYTVPTYAAPSYTAPSYQDDYDDVVRLAQPMVPFACCTA